MEIEIEKLTWEQLVALKDVVDGQLSKVERIKAEYMASRKREIISDLINGDKVFGIHFSATEFICIDYFSINFLEKNEENLIFNISTTNEFVDRRVTIDLELLKKYCVLVGYETDCVFLTLKPEIWKEDLKPKLEKYIKFKKEKMLEEITTFENNLQNLFKNDDSVDIFISNCSED